MKKCIFILLMLFVLFSQKKGNSQIDLQKKYPDLSSYNVSLLEELDRKIKEDYEPFFASDKVFFKTRMDSLSVLYNYFKNKPVCKEKIVTQYYYGVCKYHITQEYGLSLESFTDYMEYPKYLNSTRMLQITSTIGDLEKMHFNYVNALYFFNKACDLAKQNGSDLYLYVTTREIGIVYRDLNEFDKAEQYFLEASKYYDKVKSPNETRIWLDIQFSMLYRQKGDNKKSMFYSVRALNDLDNDNDIWLQAYTFYNYVEHWESIGNYDSIKFYCDKIIDLSKVKGFSEHYIVIPTYNSLGLLYLNLKDTAEGIRMLKKGFYKGIEHGVNKNTIDIAIKLLQVSEENDPLNIELTKFIIEKYQIEQSFLKESKKYANQYNDIEIKEGIVKYEKEKVRIRGLLNSILIPILFILFCVVIILVYQINLIRKQKHKHELINKELYLANVKLNQFTSVVAHDIKSNVVGIKFGLQNLKYFIEKRQFVKRQEIITDILDETDDLYTFISTLLDISKSKKTIVEEKESESLISSFM